MACACLTFRYYTPLCHVNRNSTLLQTVPLFNDVLFKSFSVYVLNDYYGLICSSLLPPLPPPTDSHLSRQCDTAVASAPRAEARGLRRPVAQHPQGDGCYPAPGLHPGQCRKYLAANALPLT